MSRHLASTILNKVEENKLHKTNPLLIMCVHYKSYDTVKFG